MSDESLQSWRRLSLVFALLLTLCFVPTIFDSLFHIPMTAAEARSETTPLVFIFLLLTTCLLTKKVKWPSGKLFCVLLFQSLIFMELTFRVLLKFKVSPKQRHAVTKQGHFLYPKSWSFIGHPFFQYVLNPKVVASINQLGFPGRDVPFEKRPDSIRVVAIGGSTTQSGYPRYLQSYLRRLSPEQSIEVINLGVSGHNSATAVVKLALLGIHYQPDYAIFHNAWNDLYVRDVNGFAPDYSHALTPLDTSYPLDGSLIHLSMLYRFVRLKLGISNQRLTARTQDTYRRGKTIDFSDQSELIPYESNLISFIRLAHGWGIMPVLTTQPFNLLKDKQGASKHIHQCNELVRKVAKAFKDQVLFIDLARKSVFRTRKTFIDLGHLDEKGKRLKAHLIGHVISSHLHSISARAHFTEKIS